MWKELAGKIHSGLENGEGESVSDGLEQMKYIAHISKGIEKFNREFERLKQIVKTSGVDAAMQELEALEKEHHEDRYFYIYTKGIFLFSLGRDKDALISFQRATELTKDDPGPNLHLAFHLDFIGRYSEAELFYGKEAAILAGNAGVGDNDIDDYLLKLLKESNYPSDKMAYAHMLCRTTDSEIHRDQGIKALIERLQDKNTSNRVWAGFALGYIRSEAAIEPLIEIFKNEEEEEIKSSISFALERINSTRAVPHLLKILENDQDDYWASSTIAGIIANQEDKEMERLIMTIIDSEALTFTKKLSVLQQTLIRTFIVGNLVIIRRLAETITDKLNTREPIFAPIMIALDYLESGRDSYILERQHPEMREAIQKLVDAYDKRRAQSLRDDISEKGQ